MAFSHYFSRRAGSGPQPIRTLNVKVRGLELSLHSAPGVFSREQIDRGTQLLLEAADFRPDDRCLDLGCGYGVVGIVAARLCPEGWAVLSDVNPWAVELAAENARVNEAGNTAVVLADRLGAFADQSFSLVLCNPPIRAGWRVVFPMIDDAPRVLQVEGRALFVARTSQGAATLQRRMAAAFGNVEIVERGSGYKVLRSVKR